MPRKLSWLRATVVVGSLVLLAQAAAAQAPVADPLAANYPGLYPVPQVLGQQTQVPPSSSLGTQQDTTDNVTPPGTIPSLTVLTPKAGDTWQVGQKYQITWQTLDLSMKPMAGLVQITLSPAQPACLSATPPCYVRTVVPYVIAKDATDNGSYTWVVPTSLADAYTGQQTITVTRADLNVSDTSGVFSISKSTTPISNGIDTLAVTSPVGGEVWHPGETHMLTWQYPVVLAGGMRYIKAVKVGTVNAISVEFANNLISDGNGSFSWTIPTTLALGQYKIRVGIQPDTVGAYADSATFTVAAAASTMFRVSDITLQPNSAYLPSANVTFKVRGLEPDGTWTTADEGFFASGQVYLNDEANPYQPVLGSSASSFDPTTGWWNITVPVPSVVGSYKMWVVIHCGFDSGRECSDTYGSGGPQVSQMVPFVVSTSAVQFVVTSPAGGETWHPGETHTLTWTYPAELAGGMRYIQARSTSTENIISIEFANNLISDGNGSFSWTIPSTAALGQYKIRVGIQPETLGASADSAAFTIAAPVPVVGQCEHAAPPDGCFWQGPETFPSCQAQLVCPAPVTQVCVPGKLSPVGKAGDIIVPKQACLQNGAVPGATATLNADGSLVFFEPLDGTGDWPSAYFPIDVGQPGIYGVHLTVQGIDGASDSFLMMLYDPQGNPMKFPGPVASADTADVRFDFAGTVNGGYPYGGWATIRGDHDQLYPLGPGQPRPEQSIPMVTWKLPTAGTYTLRIIRRENGALLKDVRLVDSSIDPFVREQTWTPIASVTPTIAPVSVQDIKTDAQNVASGNAQPAATVTSDQRAALLARADEIIKKIQALQAELNSLSPDLANIKDFVAFGTPTTQALGAGERAGVVASFTEAFGKAPSTTADWEDAVKIANGRFPTQKNAAKEQQATVKFQQIYKRTPQRAASNYDDAAVTVMAYGLRPATRNLASEAAAIKSFQATYGKTPSTAADWDTVRAIAYSGASKQLKKTAVMPVKTGTQ